MNSVYRLQEKRRKKRNTAIGLLINALADFFLYFYAEDAIREIVFSIAYEAESLEMLYVGMESVDTIMSLILIGGIVGLVISIICFCQLPTIDDEIIRAEREETHRRRVEHERMLARVEKSEAAKAEITASVKADIFVYCPQCRRKLPEKAVYCASCGFEQKLGR